MVKANSTIPKPDKVKEGLTPLMQQYQDIKSRYPGIILFFRLGDFYEMFGEDARRASPLLEVVLTQRQGVPMCGVPAHSVNGYLRKLIKAGEKVAVCEQLEEASAGRCIVRRDVVRVITPGTILEDNLLDARQNNYLACVYPSPKSEYFGLAYIDISTAEFGVTELSSDKLKNEILRLAPREIITVESYKDNKFLAESGITISTIEDWYFSFPEAESKIKQILHLQSLKPAGLEGREVAASAAGGILAYLEKTQVNQMPALSKIKYYSLDDYMLLDATAVKNLELIEGLNSHSSENSLLEAADNTLTAMGGRLLRQWLLRPLISAAAVNYRQKAVSFLIEEGLSRRQVRSQLNNIADIERIISRLFSGSAGPRELISLKMSLLALPQLVENISAKDALSVVPEPAAVLAKKLFAPQEVVDIISRAIVDEPPAVLKDGGVIKDGFDQKLDELRHISRDSKTMISDMESSERSRTGINNLKIGYTSVFGYFIEISKSNVHLAPQEYIRKQTVANGERYITPELKTFEEKILSAEEKILKLEESIFKFVREEILKYSHILQEIAFAVAELDIYASFAETAVLYNYSKPDINDGFELNIKEGRHPVIERKIKSGSFVSNDVYLNGGKDQIILLTGPNMAGKSTYLRQTALIVIMAQIGSYVPCKEAKIGIIDKIFTRIGAGDNLAGGESTFMVEMHETASILLQNTPRSLIVLDEVGRGTSTYDGISIAWSILEYLAASQKKNVCGPKVLFATHYFELTDLQGKLHGVKNYNVAVKEWQGAVIFLHKILPGAADRSYGIHVAQLAGLPKEVITRANSILYDLENKMQQQEPLNSKDCQQLDLFASKAYPDSEITAELKKTDVNNLTPMQALQLICELKKHLEYEN